MATNGNQRTLPKATGVIAGVIGVMISIFGLLNILLPTSLVQPIGALVIGLVGTAILVYLGKWTWVVALPTWLTVSIVLVIVYLFVSRPAIVSGSVINKDGSPAVGLSLVLKDHSGVEHKVDTDEKGTFEVADVPEGKYTIKTNDDLLISGEIPSGWERLFGSSVVIGQLAYKPIDVPPPSSATPAPTATATPGLSKPEINVEQFHIPFGLPETRPDLSKSIPIPRRVHVIVRTQFVVSYERYLWMFLCKRVEQGDISCNISRFDLNSSGDWDEYMNIGRLGIEDDCAWFEVGFVIVDSQTNQALDLSKPTMLLANLPHNGVLAPYWLLARRELQDDGFSPLLGCLATPMVGP